MVFYPSGHAALAIEPTDRGIKQTAFDDDKKGTVLFNFVRTAPPTKHTRKHTMHSAPCTSTSQPKQRTSAAHPAPPSL